MSLWMRKRHAIIVAKKKILKIFIGYILQLENDNWYVGITFRGTDRLYEHFCGLGAKWTKLHKPVAIHKVEYIGSDISSASAWEKKHPLVHGREGLQESERCRMVPNRHEAKTTRAYT